MGPIIILLERTLKFAWEHHYRVAEPFYWPVLLVSLLFGTATLGAGAHFTAPAFVMIAFSAQGIIRWRIERRRCRDTVVIPRFTCHENGSKALEVQDTILKSLQDHLGSSDLKNVQTIPARLGNSNRLYAERLCKRLRASTLISGDIRSTSEGEWSVFANACRPLSPVVYHFDTFTRDATPDKASWQARFERLAGTESMGNQEYPIEFATELRAVIEAIAGQRLYEQGLPEEAEPLLKHAIAVAPTSVSGAIDKLRVDRARALIDLGRRDEALELIRDRAAGDNVSPELLRQLDFIIRFSGECSETEAMEGISALRRALEEKTDPERDMTVFNLARALANHPDPALRSQGIEMIEGLLESEGHYRSSWHVKRFLGSVAWAEYEETYASGEPDLQKGATAARWYSAAIRARPRVLFFPNGVQVRFLNVPGVPPVMYANAKDAHEAAGQKWRAWWNETRFIHRRRRLTRNATRSMKRNRWDDAVRDLGWIASVGRGDIEEAQTLVAYSVALLQAGHVSQAEIVWNQCYATFPPGALLVRSTIATSLDLPKGVPGSQPVHPEEVHTLIVQHFASEGNRLPSDN